MKNFRKRLSYESREDYYNMHWRVVNAIFELDLTPREISLLAAFMAQRADQYTFDTTSRKEVLDKLGLSTSLVSNYLKRLVKKGVLRVELDETGVKRTRLVDALIPGAQLQDYIIRIENEGHK